nr:hypothetical protein [Streptomyces sp. ERV7]
MHFLDQLVGAVRAREAVEHVLEDERGLEDRRAAGLRCLGQIAGERGERVAVQHPVDDLALHLGHQLPEGRALGEGHPYGHHVDHESHGVGEFVAAPLVHGHPDDDLALGGVTGERHGVRGEHDRGDEGAPCGSHLLDGVGEFAGQLAEAGLSGEPVGDLGVRPVGGQAQRGGQARQLLPPVVEQLRAATRQRRALLAHERLEVRARAGRFRLSPGQQRLVCVEQRLGEEPGRTAVEDEVVDADEHDRGVRRAGEDPDPQQRLPFHGERPLVLGLHGLQHPGLGQRAQIHARVVEFAVRIDRLHRPVALAAQDRAQHRMPPDHRSAGPLEHRLVEPGDPEAERDVVRGHPRIRLLERPETVLALGELVRPRARPEPPQKVPDLAVGDLARPVVGDEGAELVLHF